MSYASLEPLLCGWGHVRACLFKGLVRKFARGIRPIILATMPVDGLGFAICRVNGAVVVNLKSSVIFVRAATLALARRRWLGQLIFTMMFLAASLLDLRTSLISYVRIAIVREFIVFQIHVDLVRRTATIAFKLIQGYHSLGRLLAVSDCLNTLALHWLLLEGLVEGHLSRSNGSPSLLLVLLAEALAQFSTRLHVQLGRRRLLIDDWGLFVTEEQLDLLFILSNQDHVIEANFLFLFRFGALDDRHYLLSQAIKTGLNDWTHGDKVWDGNDR